jgi:hypothetical protein
VSFRLAQLVASDAGPTLLGVTGENAKAFLLDVCRAATEVRAPAAGQAGLCCKANNLSSMAFADACLLRTRASSTR